jgi:predicted RecA/RadA family phage recombinase
MALSSNAAVLRMPEGLVEYPVAAGAVIYQGAMLGLASGYARPLAAGDVFIGVAYEKIDNTGGAAGARKVRVQVRGIYRLAGSGFAQTTVGASIYASDDATATTTASGNSLIGKCVKFESATAIWVRIAP